MRSVKELDRQIASAMGEISPDVLLTDGELVNVVTGEIYQADIAIKDDRIVRVGDCNDLKQKFKSDSKIIDCKNSYLIPGLIDTHLHTESTMLPPSQFASVVLPRGTTTVVVDPHEIGNALGIRGIELYVEETRNTDLEFLVEVPSCVPSAPGLETSSNTLTSDDLKPLINDPKYFALAEMMNFPGVIYRDEDVLKKISITELAGKICEGHSPGLKGKDLQAYLTAGISSCHESFEVEEVLEKLRLGCYIQLREGSFTKNLINLGKGIKRELKDAKSPWRNVIIASDDRHANDLLSQGHLDHSLRLLVNEVGLDPIKALQICTINPANHIRRKDLGVIGPGKTANIVKINNLKEFKTLDVISKGKHVAHNNELLNQSYHKFEYPPWALDTVTPKFIPEENDMSLHAPEGIEEGKLPAHIIGAVEHSVMTNHIVEKVPIENNKVILTKKNDLTYLFLLERYGITKHFSKALTKGFKFTQQGAIASTVCHDSHQLLLLGNSQKSMKLALNSVLIDNGGLAIVKENGRNEKDFVIESLPLPYGGLMSTDSPKGVAKKLTKMKTIANKLCDGISEPFMALSFMALPVIPKLKLTDLGLVDVDKFQLIKLFDN
ncbi:MAG: adenine deaminase [Candidatus Hodarchaeales archaeon]|jgi:adenine deaminase